MFFWAVRYLPLADATTFYLAAPIYVTALSVLQLLPYPAASHAPGSSIKFGGEELVGAAPARLRGVRGNRIGIVFQEPMTSLNPLHTLEKQIA